MAGWMVGRMVGRLTATVLRFIESGQSVKRAYARVDSGISRSPWDGIFRRACRSLFLFFPL